MEKWLREVWEVKACEEFQDGVATTDVPIGEHVWVRIFRPQSLTRARPVVLYAHGGAYCVGQPSTNLFHAFCFSMCKLSNTIWVSVSYRLAPHHRLPAAFDDTALALRWLVSQATQQPLRTCHPWLASELADFSHCFMAGESAGASIVLKVARDAAAAPDFGPMSIKGLMLMDPGFNSESKREAMMADENAADLKKVYEMALPEGETLDYAPVNPLHVDAPPLQPLSLYPHIFIGIADKDYHYDMTIQFYELVKGFCANVQLLVTPGKGHGFHLLDPHCPEAQRLHVKLANFLEAA